MSVNKNIFIGLFKDWVRLNKGLEEPDKGQNNFFYKNLKKIKGWGYSGQGVVPGNAFNFK